MAARTAEHEAASSGKHTTATIQRGSWGDFIVDLLAEAVLRRMTGGAGG
ncbi:MAG: hypothetical protein U0V56_11880 [Actinomycetota bacterium]